jgi:hypothetical protein
MTVMERGGIAIVIVGIPRRLQKGRIKRYQRLIWSLGKRKDGDFYICWDLPLYIASVQNVHYSHMIERASVE